MIYGVTTQKGINMIDPDKVKEFWEGRAELYSKIALESVANLEHDPENLRLKVDEETNKVFSWLPDIAGKSVLDLGAGVGQWSFRFAERGARRVLAVEYTRGLVDIGRAEATERGMDQVEFIVSSAEQFCTTEQFDLVFISGLFVYLNDDQFSDLLGKLNNYVSHNGMLMLRDGVGVLRRHEINDCYSEHLESNYSAIYRTADEFISAFDASGFTCVKTENMFPEGHLLNKYPETRLRLFTFRKT